ncbi:MAG: Thioredoxin [Candidatus Heimdallarchaeota archaeon LC_2]|nr:MAG: Thioredoxin [Candidatus Heimdallarchaeota archaeon LC_2]
MSTTAATSKPIVLSEGDFEDYIQNTPIMVVDFWAEWCGPCKMVGPILDELAGEYEGKVWVGKVDTDANRQIAMKYGASSIPTFWAFKEGVPVGRFVGAQPKAAFVDVFKQLIELDMDKVRAEMAEKEKGN